MPTDDPIAFPTVKTLQPWYRRLPVTLLFFIWFAPFVFFAANYSCVKHEPGFPRPLDEILLPSSGAPIALILAIISLSPATPLRKLGLYIVVVFTSLSIAGTLIGLVYRN